MTQNFIYRYQSVCIGDLIHILLRELSLILVKKKKKHSLTQNYGLTYLDE